jgi:hypothetical protein
MRSRCFGDLCSVRDVWRDVWEVYVRIQVYALLTWKCEWTERATGTLCADDGRRRKSALGVE